MKEGQQAGSTQHNRSTGSEQRGSNKQKQGGVGGTLQNFGSRIAGQYNGLSTTQKVVGATLLTASAAYLTRNMWGASSLLSAARTKLSSTGKSQGNRSEGGNRNSSQRSSQQSSQGSAQSSQSAQE